MYAQRAGPDEQSSTGYSWGDVNAEEDSDKGKGKSKGSAVLPNMHAPVSDRTCQGEGSAHDTQLGDTQPDDTLSDDEQWSMGDIFQGFEFEVPTPPEGLKWVPTPPQGCYRLVKAGGGQPDEQSDDGQPDEQSSTHAPVFHNAFQRQTTDMDKKENECLPLTDIVEHRRSAEKKVCQHARSCFMIGQLHSN